jgi:hypothetical protein
MANRTQTRQARRQAARRQQHAPSRPALSPSRPVVAGAAVVVAALVLFALAAAGIFKGPGPSTNGVSASAATATAIVNTLGPGYTVDGIHCDTSGAMAPGTPHIHADVVIYDHGVRWTMNPNVGHDTNNDCLFWVHAHADAAYGVIHMESPRPIHPTLTVWNAVALHSVGRSAEMQLKPRPGEQQRVYVNDRRYHGDISRLPLQNHMSITIEYGPPWVKPHLFDFKAHRL